MTFATIALALMALFSPRQSASIAAVALKAPSVAPALAEVCWRESRCNPIGVHRGDARWSRKVFWRGATQRWLDLRCQNIWQGNWSTRGAFGLMAAYNVRHIAPCVPPHYLDVPLISALVSAIRLIEHCDRQIEHRHPATSRWAFDDRICGSVPYAHARTADYQIARAKVRAVLSGLMPRAPDPPRVPATLPDDGHSTEDDTRRDARGLPTVEPPERRTDDATPSPKQRRG